MMMMMINNLRIMTLLIIAIIILYPPNHCWFVCLLLFRRVTRTKSISKPAQRMECVENSYAVDAVVLKGVAGCSSTDKIDDDPKYQSIRDPPSPPPRYSTVEDADKVFVIGEESPPKQTQ